MLNSDAKKILLVDEHPAVRVAVKAIIERQGFSVVGEADSCDVVLPMVEKLSPDMLILDLKGGVADIHIVQRVMSTFPGIRVVVYTAQEARHFSSGCLRAGVSGYVHKSSSVEEFVGAVRAVFSNYYYYPREGFGVNENRLYLTLTKREKEVFGYLARGMSNKEISEILDIHGKTVSTFKTKVLKKLGLRNHVDAFNFSARLTDVEK